MNVVFEAGHGPKISGNLNPSLWNQQTADHLKPTYDAITLTRKRLASDKSLLGFCGAPWTLLAYMINGKNKNEFANARAAAQAHTQQYEDQLQMMTQQVTAHAQRQIEAGADAIMLFDSWAGLLPETAYLNSVIHPLKKISSELRKIAPVIVFMRSSAQHVKYWAEVPANAFQVDFTANLLDIHQALPDHILQGNLDPAVLLNDDQNIIEHTQRILDLPLKHQFIFNLGHGVLPNTRPEAVKTLLTTIHQHKVQYV
jgi:uroporphyrinogen decarboxylase